MAQQFADDEARRVAGDGKTQALRHRNDGRVDADYLAGGRDQRPTGIAGLSAASVCTTSSIGRPVRPRSERFSALTTPAVTVDWKP